MDNTGDMAVKQALLYQKVENDKVRCNLCGHHCTIADGKRGVCSVRENRGGTLYSLVYGKPISGSVDPIEKKPLYHVLPGSRSFSIATLGCNFQCDWCQNCGIAQIDRDQRFPEETRVEPAAIVDQALSHRCESIAYTYTEPTVFFEYAHDIARLARPEGLLNIFVTNGFMTAEMLDLAQPWLDAANVDLKGFTDDLYRKYVGASLQPVLDSIVGMKKRGIWVEVTTLIIPGLNDSSEELTNAARFIAHEVGTDTPWHLSRFFPNNRMTDRNPTPVDKLVEARDIGRAEGLQYVYIGNATGEDFSDTHCPGCGRVVISRSLGTSTSHCRDGICPQCHTVIAGVGP